MPRNSVRIRAVQLSTNFSKDSCRIFTSVSCIHKLIHTNTRTYPQQTITFTQTLTYTHFLTYTNNLKPFLHTPFNTYTHLHTTHTSTYMILHTNSVRRPSGRADEINLISTAALNPFQKICYKVLFRNVAPSRGPRLCRPLIYRKYFEIDSKLL